MRTLRVVTAFLLTGCGAHLAAQSAGDSTLGTRRHPLAALNIVARIPLPQSPDWIAPAFGSVWVVNYAPNRVSRIDPRRGRVIADIPLSGKACLGIVIALKRVWIPTCDDGVINEVDPATNEVVRRVPVPIRGGREGLFAFANGSFWVPANAADSLSSSIARVDARSGRVLATILVAERTDAVIAGFDALWAASSATAAVFRIDPRRNAVVARIAVGPSPKFMAAGEDAVWVQNRGDGSVSRLDPRTNKEVARVAAFAPTEWGDIATGSGAVWLSVGGKPVTRIDPRTNRVTHQFVGEDGADAIRVGAGALWVTDHKHGELWKIDFRRIQAAR